MLCYDKNGQTDKSDNGDNDDKNDKILSKISLLYPRLSLLTFICKITIKKLKNCKKAHVGQIDGRTDGQTDQRTDGPTE